MLVFYTSENSNRWQLWAPSSMPLVLWYYSYKTSFTITN